MADDVLRLRAEIADKLSGPLKNIQRELGSFGRGSGAGVGNVKREFDALHGVVGKVGKELKSITLPALGALGLASGGIVASLVGVTNVLRGLSERALDLHNLAKETGTSVSQFKAFSRQMELLRISPEAAAAGLQTLSKNLFEVRNRLNGPMVAELRAKGGGELIAQLRESKDSFEALNRIVDYGERVQQRYGVEGKKRFYELTLGNAEFARLNKKELQEMQALQAKANNELDPKAAREYLKAWLDLDHAFSKMKKTIGMELMPPLTLMIKKFDAFVESPKGKEMMSDIAAGIKAVGRALKDADWEDFGKKLKSVDEAVQSVGGWKTIFIGLAGIKLVGLVAEITAVAGALKLIPIGTLSLLGKLGIVGVAIGAATADKDQGPMRPEKQKEWDERLKRFLPDVVEKSEKGDTRTWLEKLFGKKAGEEAGEEAGKGWWQKFKESIGLQSQSTSPILKDITMSKAKGAAFNLSGVVDALSKTARIPGDAMAGKYATTPTTQGQWSEEDQFRSDSATRQETRDALGLSAYGAGASGGLLKNLVPESMPGLVGKMQARTPFRGRSGSRERDAGSGGLGGVPRIKSPSTVPDMSDGSPMGGGIGSRIARSKAAAIDQLRSEGVPEANIQEAANLLVGQQLSESGSLNPRQSHDQGTGTGIYGARLDRRDKMFAWMAEQGFKSDSLEGQSKYMAHEAMTGRDYGATRQALMNADPSTRGQATHTITRNFERPAVINDRTGNVARAAGVEADATGYRPLTLEGVRKAVGGLAGEPGAEGGEGQVRQRQGGAGIRRLPLSESTKSYLEYASGKTGLVPEVFSGGQPSSGPNRTGSHRHDWGGAGDLKLRDPQTGQMLDMRNPADAARMAEFTEHAVRAGATGVGAGTGYMGPNSLHIGGGRATTWGGAPWIAGAWQRGMKNQMSPEELQGALGSQRMDRELARQGGPTKVEGSGTLTVDVRAPRGTKVDAEGGGIFRQVRTNRQLQMEPSATGPEE